VFFPETKTSGGENLMQDSIIFLEPKGTIFEVIRVASQRGYQVIVLSSDLRLIEEAPEPYRSATFSIKETFLVPSWSDREIILSIVKNIQKNYSVRGVYFGLDPCAVIGTELRRLFNLPSPSPKTLELVLDKFRLRTKLRALGLSKLKSVSGSEVDDWTQWNLSSPAYFKPVYGVGSVYVAKCHNYEELKLAQANWRERMPNDPEWVTKHLNSKSEYHLEEAFEGELLSVEAISFGGKFKVLGLLSRILYSKDPVIEMGSCFPYPHPLSEKIISFVEEVHQKLEFTDGATHTEIIVNSKEEMEIIDFNPRFVGADVLQSINFAFDIKVQNLLLDFALGIEPQLQKNSENYSCLQYMLPPSIEIFESIEFPETNDIKFKTTYLKTGVTIKRNKTQLDYLASYLTTMPTFESALARSKELRNQVIINKTHQGVY
jgi:predicted ATP-grasp superfamily ATP-dependent carboligase